MLWSRGAGRQPPSLCDLECWPWASHKQDYMCGMRLFPKKNTPPQLPLSLINGEALSREQTVKYLGVNFTSNLAWYTHIDSVFIKCLKLSFVIRRLRSMNVNKSPLWRIVSACAIPSILYWSPYCLTKTSPLLKNAYVCYQLPAV